jgi:hypothetical protein
MQWIVPTHSTLFDLSYTLLLRIRCKTHLFGLLNTSIASTPALSASGGWRRAGA